MQMSSNRPVGEPFVQPKHDFLVLVFNCPFN